MLEKNTHNKITDIQTDGQIDRETKLLAEGQTDKKKDGQTDRQPRQTDIFFFILTERQTDRQTYKQTSRQADKQTYLQTDNQTYKQTDKHTYIQTDREAHRHT